MKKIIIFYLMAGLFICCNQQKIPNALIDVVPGPIQLHPENPHYFLYKGKPKVLITSAEHYGAVLNQAFDYEKYLGALYEDGMNYTRIFSGTYFEIAQQSFGIQHNTLAPDPDKIITPWKLTPTDESGLQKYDLSTWNDAYFQRLKDFIHHADSLDIIVELTIFCSIYSDGHWHINPQNPANNINITHPIDRSDAHTMQNGDLFEFQQRLVSKLVNELNHYDNLFYEIQNEPWADRPVAVYNIVNKEELRSNDWTFKADFGDTAAMEWQKQMADLITKIEDSLPKRHLIAQNYTNFRAPIPEVNANISIINFHYAWPEAARWNYHFDKVIGFDESGFAGSGDQVYRRQAWQFLFSGGALFNNLDYSFYVGQESGLGENDAPGGGSKLLRNQLHILSDYLHNLSLEKFNPDYSVIFSSPGLIPYALSDGEKYWCIFLRSVGTDSSRLRLNTGNGNYTVKSMNTITGKFNDPREITASNGRLEIDIQIPEGELVLSVIKN